MQSCKRSLKLEARVLRDSVKALCSSEGLLGVSAATTGLPSETLRAARLLLPSCTSRLVPANTTQTSGSAQFDPLRGEGHSAASVSTFAGQHTWHPDVVHSCLPSSPSPSSPSSSSSSSSSSLSSSYLPSPQDGQPPNTSHTEALARATAGSWHASELRHQRAGRWLRHSAGWQLQQLPHMAGGVQTARTFWGSSAASSKAGAAGASGEEPSPPTAEGDLPVPEIAPNVDLWNPASWHLEVITEPLQKAVEKLPQPLQEALDPSSPYVQGIGVFSAFVGAWTLLPMYLRRVHRQVELQTSVLRQLDTLARRRANGGPRIAVGDSAAPEETPPPPPTPYDKSAFGALEDPLRFLVSLVTLNYTARLLAPSSDVVHLLEQSWSGALVLSLLWFLYRVKSNYLAATLARTDLPLTAKTRVRTLDRVSTIALLAVGGLSVAESSGVALQSLLTVGGIGGVATAFAARDVIGNFLSGIMLYVSQPFKIGDKIVAGNVKGRVVDIGLNTTQLMNPDRFPVTVPNSYFTSQVIINESRAGHLGFATTVPILLSDLDKIPNITRAIRSMLSANPKVFLSEERPRAYLHKVTGSDATVVVTCNVRPMSSDEYYITEEELLYDIARIISESGARIGYNLPDEPVKRLYGALPKQVEHAEVKRPSF